MPNIDTGDSELRSEILARLLLVQNIAGQMPDEASIIAFVCRGLEHVPGVESVKSLPREASPPPVEPQEERYSLHYGGTVYGDVVVRLNGVNAYSPYRAHVQNLLFVIGVMLEERRQRRLTEAQQRELEERVRQRTADLALEVQERRAAEAALAKEKDLLDVTLRSIGDGVITTDTLGHVTNINPVAEQLTGWRLEQAQGQPISEVFVQIDEQSRRILDDPVLQVLTHIRGCELPDSHRLRSRQGSIREVAGSAAPIRDRDGQIVGAVLSFRDVTERNRLLEGMQRAERLDAIGTLAGGIAHDFNNLLGGIFGYLCLAREGAAEGSDQASALDEALLVFERARDLTRQLLTFSKGGAPVRSAVNLRRLLTECTRFALSGSNVASKLTFSHELPEVAADAGQLWRVIDNLVRNSMQAMPHGGTVSVTGDRVVVQPGNRQDLPEGEYVQITVSDNGPGIPRHVLPRIFDPFFTTKEQGTGLGLATAYSIVRKHEGHIDVESTIDVGTTFRIYLPVVVAGAVTASSMVRLPTEVRGAGRALVLDDEGYLRNLYSRLLTRVGYEVSTVPDGNEAVAVVERANLDGRPFTVALLDLTIPGGMGGKEVLALIRPQCPNLIAIAASGYSEDPVMARPADFGFTASLCKPFALSELANLLGALSRPEADPTTRD
ncbi:MAG TPA: ATP-binding protein [Polyangiaceae bacterium]|nr:ATP-binding protein [Polyangiaceae bacterium]